MCSTETLDPVSLDNVDSPPHQFLSRHESDDDCLAHESNGDADQLFGNGSDSSVDPAVQESIEDFEVRIGAASVGENIDQDSTLPWNPHDLNTMQVQSKTKIFENATQTSFS